jgi:hypothetical protein
MEDTTSEAEGGKGKGNKHDPMEKAVALLFISSMLVTGHEWLGGISRGWGGLNPLPGGRSPQPPNPGGEGTPQESSRAQEHKCTSAEGR